MCKVQAENQVYKKMFFFPTEEMHFEQLCLSMIRGILFYNRLAWEQSHSES